MKCSANFQACVLCGVDCVLCGVCCVFCGVWCMLWWCVLCVVRCGMHTAINRSAGSSVLLQLGTFLQ